MYQASSNDSSAARRREREATHAVPGRARRNAESIGARFTCRQGGERSTPSDKRQRVQVWFGKEVICSHEADAAQAQRYAALMARRFAGPRVTIDDHPSSSDRSLPNELLWDSTVM
jgi:hypothetical protein